MSTADLLSFYKSRGGDNASQADWWPTGSGRDDGAQAIFLLEPERGICGPRTRRTQSKAGPEECKLIGSDDCRDGSQRRIK